MGVSLGIVSRWTWQSRRIALGGKLFAGAGSNSVLAVGKRTDRNRARLTFRDKMFTAINKSVMRTWRTASESHMFGYCRTSLLTQVRERNGRHR